MKLPAGLLLLCLALTVSSRAEEVMPVKTEAAAVKRELVWPEIKDPQALIEFAKVMIQKCGSITKGDWIDLEGTAKHEFAYLRPYDCYGDLEHVVIILDKHPFTGQALLITPDLEYLTAKDRRISLVENTKTAEIKYVLTQLPESSESLFAQLSKISIRWRNLQNLDDNKCSWAKPVSLPLPEYPIELIEQRIEGEVRVEFVVKVQGTINDLKVHGTRAEFESVVKDIAQKWRFEPGVDLETRLPAATQMSLMVRFSLKED